MVGIVDAGTLNLMLRAMIEDRLARKVAADQAEEDRKAGEALRLRLAQMRQP